jgi:hypothetical protein
MAEAQWWSPSVIDRTIEVPDIGRATRITSGSLAIGCTEMVRKSGDAVTTSYADID